MHHQSCARPEKLPLAALRDSFAAKSRLLERGSFHLIGAIPANPELTACRAIDIARHLGGEVLHEGEIQTRRVKKFRSWRAPFPTCSIPFRQGSILVTPVDRSDVIMAVALAALKTPIAGLVLTGGFDLDQRVWNLSSPGLETGLPVIRVESNSWETATHLHQMDPEVPEDDLERVQLGMDHVALYIDADWTASVPPSPSRPACRRRHFVFASPSVPERRRNESSFPRVMSPDHSRGGTLCTAKYCSLCSPRKSRGNPTGRCRVEVELPKNLEILDPSLVRANHVGPLVEMRKHKGLTSDDAAELLKDNVWLGTVMLAQGEVDGLVSGAVHSTANTIRPALQIIKTKPGAKCLLDLFHVPSEQVLVWRLRGESRSRRGNAR